ncbi:hypothetical protein SAMN02745227_01061 [Anaerobranca californiensis DSM 14826]|uniref:Uncharacterized protein n=1 Tax=Anaerobranca californiensis DSM 14826 TaxID=1120989 RepID=A0A1M6N8J6_9FIRM|nr:hypothetical protein [Anaerobranca californiensis]SHJ91981.1 hypothetical protein SAMN02745227_01061 [Anaerobranca californiensis DSM 14826]
MDRMRTKIEKGGVKRKPKKVKVVVSQGTVKFLKYTWFPVMAALLFIIGLQIGIYLITKDNLGNFTSLFDRDMWSNFWDAIKNF